MENIDVDLVKPIYQKYKESPYPEDRDSKRKQEVISFKSDAIQSSSSLQVEIPKLVEGICMVPNTFNLILKLESTNTKAWFLNNTNRLLCKDLKIYFAGQKVYDNPFEHLFRIYEDLWLHSWERNRMQDFGIMSENMRKLLANDDSADSAAAVMLIF
jgi:hypothetical protein